MNKLFIVFLFSLAFISSSWSQGERLSDYSFIVVPKKFDFQFGEDQYQLNSLLKFLFNKYGFHAYFDEELPDVKRCDGLRAEVIGDPGFIWCRVTISIKDCNGNVLYTSQEGKSKQKEYSKMYNEALRRAFESIEVLFVQQKDVKLLNSYDEDTSITKEKTISISNENNPLLLPISKYTNFSNGGKSYLLRKTEKGYSLYEETAEAKDGLDYKGKIFIVEEVVFFEDVNEDRFLAFFDTSGNFTVDANGKKVVYLKN